MRRLVLMLLFTAVSAACGPKKIIEPPEPPPPELKLHVPSPAWEDQIIYFLMTDRLANGDPLNDDQGKG